jgi:ABC-type multidrug transport system permease subunit
MTLGNWTSFSRGVTCGGTHMFYRIAADLVIFVHFLWIAFVILGFPVFLYLNFSRWRVFHLLALIAMVVMQLTGTICPLTYLEAYLKSKGESNRVYPGQFTIDTIEKLIYVEDLTLEKITYATIIFLALVLLTFWLKPVHFKRQPKG